MCSTLHLGAIFLVLESQGDSLGGGQVRIVVADLGIVLAAEKDSSETDDLGAPRMESECELTRPHGKEKRGDGEFGNDSIDSVASDW